MPLLLSEGSTEAIIMKCQAAGKGAGELARPSEQLADVSHRPMLCWGLPTEMRWRLPLTRTGLDH